MNPLMRAKMRVTGVNDSTASLNVQMMAVSEKPFDADGVSEDNDYARWTPMASVGMTIQNPALFGKIKEGQTFFVNFTPADQSEGAGSQS